MSIPNGLILTALDIGNAFTFSQCCGSERQWHPLQYSCLENPRDGGAWWAAVHGIAKSRTWLSNFTLTFHFHALEKEMETHSSVLAWRIPGTGEPGGLPSIGSHRVGHDWSNLAATAAMLWVSSFSAVYFQFQWLYFLFLDVLIFFTPNMLSHF